jgi:hypothetical protein
MAFCITLGKFKYKYKYIFYSAISLLISDFSFGINYHGVFNDVSLIKIFGIVDDEQKFYQHYYIRQIFCYFGTFILSIILYKIEASKSRSESIKSMKESSSNINSSYNSNSEIKLIYEKNDLIIYSKFFVLKLLFLILLWVMEEKFTEKLNSILKHLDFWMLEFIFLTIFCKKYLQKEIYRHQMLAMLLTVLPCTLKIATIFLSFDDEEETNSDNFRRNDELMKILYVPYPWLIPIGIIIYLSMKIMRAYIKTQIKWYMDIKYVSITKLLMNYGIIGTIFYTIICTITTFADCPHNDKNFEDYFCGVQENNNNHNNNNNKKYFASFRLYFRDILFKHSWKEIILLIIGILGFSFYKFYSLMIIKKLTPIHLVFSLPLFYIMRKIFLSISILFNNSNKASDIYIYKYIIDTVGDFLCIFAYLIYLEIIKLNFCNLNFNLRDNIITRGQTELCPKEDLINEEDESSIDRGDTKNSLNSND